MKNNKTHPKTTRRSGGVHIADVAKRAGVSVSTVSRVLNGIEKRASPKTIEKVRTAAAALDYRPQWAGRSLRTQKTRLVAVMVPDISNDYYATLARSIEFTLHEDGYTMILSNTDEQPSRQDEFLAEVQSLMVCCAVMLGAVESPGLVQFVQTGFPMILVNRRLPFPNDCPFVGIDNYGAGADIAQRFLDQGYEVCAAIVGPSTSSASVDRLNGFRDRLAEADMTINAQHLKSGPLTMEAGYNNALLLLTSEPRPRAIFCGNDLIAYGVYRRARELGLSIPRDLAICGFDNHPLDDWTAPWLTTVGEPYELYGPAVHHALQQLVTGRGGRRPKEIILPYRMVIRESA